MPTSVFGDYARDYDLLYSDKNYEAEANFVIDILKRHASPVDTILDLGCGSGMHAEKFAEAGYSVVGADLSPVMIDLAEQRRGRAGYEAQRRLAFVQSDIRALRLDRRFDAVTALFHVMSYMPGNDDVEAALASAREHLNAGGIFVFDFWYGPAVLHLLPSERMKVFESEERKLWRFAKPTHFENENLVDVNYTLVGLDKGSARIAETKETHRMRYFFKPELAYFLKAAGFKLNTLAEWMTGGPPGMNAWNVVCVAEAA
jgi:SAM-dependent methyltransferase